MKIKRVRKRKECKSYFYRKFGTCYFGKTVVLGSKVAADSSGQIFVNETVNQVDTPLLHPLYSLSGDPLLSVVNPMTPSLMPCKLNMIADYLFDKNVFELL